MLAKDDRHLGVWRSDAERGVHAVVIGISEYPFLTGGNDPARRTAGMGQLVVSAATAAQVFSWLQSSGRLGGRPIASCRLLLAPGTSAPAGKPDEREFVNGLTGGWYDVPNFQQLRDAVTDWANEFYRAPAQLSAENGAFFFFSGHGLQVLAQPSLLARDILDPGSFEGARNALAYRSILDTLPTYGLGDGLFLFDSCRNGPEVAQQFNMVGRPVLEPVAGRNAVAPRSMKYLAATEGDGRAYQDPQSPRRATLFGEALLEALEGVAPDYGPYDVQCMPWRLMFEALESYTRKRVVDLLRGRQAQKIQKVASGGEASEQDILVAERNPPPGYAPVPAGSLQQLLGVSPAGVTVIEADHGTVSL